LDPAEALSRLSNNTPIQSLVSYLEAVIREMMETHRNNEVRKNLLKAEDLQVRKEYVVASSRVVRIDEDVVCSVCNRLIGITYVSPPPITCVTSLISDPCSIIIIIIM
jgi:predicted ATPase